MAIGNFTSYGAESIGKILTTTSVTDIFTVPQDERYIVKSVIVFNSDAGVTSTTIQWYDNSEAATLTLLQSNITASDTVELLAHARGPLVFAGGDKLQLQAGTANAIHASISYMTLGRLSGRT